MMASKLSPATPRSKLLRGSGLEIDRTSPAGKTPMSMNGDNSPRKRTPVSRGAELIQVQEELAKTKEQLSLMEKSKANLFQDLARSKRQIDDLTAKLLDATEVSKKDRIRAEEMEQATFTVAEDWQVEVDEVRQQYEAAMAELQSNRELMESLKHELMMSTEAKNEAVRLAGEAMNAAETTAKRVEELSAELLAAKRTNGAGDAASKNVDELNYNCVAHVEDDTKRDIPAKIGDFSSSAACEWDTAHMIAAKETELDIALKEADDARTEIEALKQELILAQASSYENVQNTAVLLAAKEAELDKALRESSLARIESKGLKQELSLAQAHANESAQSAELLLASKEVELEKALQMINHTKVELEILKQELVMVKEQHVQHLTSNSTLELLQKQLQISEENEEAYKMQLHSISSDLKKLTSELTESKQLERNLKSQLEKSASAAEQSQLELMNAKLAEEEAIVAARNAQADYEKLRTELVKLRETNSETTGLISRLTLELKEAQEKLYQKASQGAMLETLLNTLKADLEETQGHLATLEKKEASANVKAEALNLKLTTLTEEHKEEVIILNSKIASSDAALESLRLELETQKLELANLAHKHSATNADLDAVLIKLRQTEEKALELKRQELTASERGATLCIELENAQKELLTFKEKDLSMTYKVGSLLDDLEAKNLEMLDLVRRMASAEDEAAASKTKLELAQTELTNLRERELGMNSKAAALSVALASLSENTENKLLELKQKEELANVQATALHDELRRIGLEYENALMASKLDREEVDRLTETLQVASSEKELARQEVEAAKNEAQKSRECMEIALSEAQSTRKELQKALEEAQSAEQRAQEGGEEARGLKISLQAAEQDLLIVRTEGDKVREEVQAALAVASNLSKDLDQERQETHLLKQEMLALQADLVMVKEQARAANNDHEAAKKELESLKVLVESANSAEFVAQSACESAKTRLQDVLLELEKVKSQASLVQGDMKHCPDLSTKESPTNSITPEEFDNVRLRLEDAESRLLNVTKELQASASRTEELSKELEAVKLDKELNERAVLEVHQLLADTEKAKANLEAEIQRLLDESKQWQVAKDPIDIPVHSEVNGRSFSFECREDKPQPDVVDKVSDFTSPPMEENNKDEDTLKREDSGVSDEVGSKEDHVLPSATKPESPDCDEVSVKDEVLLQDEPLAVPLKKKKKNLLGRLGTLLDKKKHSPHPTP